MHGDALVIVLLLVFGCAAFLFGVIYLLLKLLAALGRGVAGVFRRPSSGNGLGEARVCSRVRVCPRERCRKVEYRDARYCSQCGTPLVVAPPAGKM